MRYKVVIDVNSNMSYMVPERNISNTLRIISHANVRWLIGDKAERYKYSIELMKYLHMAGIRNGLVDAILYDSNGRIVGIVVDIGRRA